MLLYINNIIDFAKYMDIKKIKLKSDKNIQTNEFGFSLAEFMLIVIVIGIISVIIFIVIKHKFEDKWNAEKIKAEKSIGKSFKLMSEDNIITDSLTTEEFTKQIIPGYLKLKKSCNAPKDCEFPTRIKRPDGAEIELKLTLKEITFPVSVLEEATTKTLGVYSEDNPTTNKYNNAYFFITSDGFHVMFFYNPYCVSSEEERPYFLDEEGYSYTTSKPQMSLDTSCYFGLYDSNGMKKPNQIGKDIGLIGSFYRKKNTKAVSVLPYKEERSTDTLPTISDTNHWKAAFDYCESIDNNKWRLPDINELSLIYLTKYFVTNNNSKWFWSISGVSGTTKDFRGVNFTNGRRRWPGFSGPPYWVRCIRKS